MKVQWSSHANRDLIRLHDFLARVDSYAAADLIDRLSEAPEKLLAFPRLGPRVETTDGRELRQLNVGKHILYYRILGDGIEIVRAWHGREERI